VIKCPSIHQQADIFIFTFTSRMLYIAWAPCYAHPLPAGHRFPMAKYELLPEQLLHEGTITTANIFTPEPLNNAAIELTHDAAYLHKLDNLTLSAPEIRRTGFPLSQQLIEREKTILDGAVLCADYALKHGIAMNIAGGTHHAFADHGEGFCLLNDIAVAANILLHKKKVRRILVVDLDVHQGNGTAKLFEENPAVFTFSMHGEHNFPLHKEQSDLDIELPDGTDDNYYLKLLQNHLPRLIDTFEPDFVFYQAGVDVLATDKLGRLKMSQQGCADRDRFVLEICSSNRIPVAVCMGGGYSEKLSTIVEAHANIYRLAQEIFF
jgi:acetoin utilization deacetylase AcuC-like enzyme